MFGQPVAPGTVGQNHGFRDDQIERCAALTNADLHGLRALRLGTLVSNQPEVVIRPIEGLGLAACEFAPDFQMLGQSEQKGQGLALWLQSLRLCRMHPDGVLQPLGGDDGVELIMAQIGGYVHTFDLRSTAQDGQRRFIQFNVE